MKKIELFKGLRVQEINGEVLVNLEDISIGLGFTQTKLNQVYIRKETVTKYLSEFGFPISWEEDTMVSESVFYLLAMKANNKTAKQFQIKVATEIIPEYRKSIKPTDLNPYKNISKIDALKLAIESEEKALKYKALAEKNQTRADYLNHVMASDETIDIGQAAKVLAIPKVGRNTLFKELRDRGYFFKNRNEPKQQYINQGLFLLKEKFIPLPNGDEKLSMKVYVTQKGLAFIAKWFDVIPTQNNQMSIQ